MSYMCCYDGFYLFQSFGLLDKKSLVVKGIKYVNIMSDFLYTCICTCRFNKYCMESKS